MKKILLFFTFLFLFYTSFSLLFYEKNQAKSAFNEEEFSTYSINFEKNLITTKQLSNLLNQENFQIVSITPYYSPIYEKKIAIKSFPFSSFSKNVSLKAIEKKYFLELSKLGLQKEIVKYKVQGIPIHYLEVYTNEIYIQKLKEKYPLITYHEKN